MRKLALLLVMAGVILMAACGGGGNGTSTVTSVSVTCSPTTVSSGGTSQCSATVSGTGFFATSVTWASSAGTISSSGLFTAPTVTSQTAVTVTATSTQNTSVSGSATVTVTPGSTTSNVAPIIVDGGPEPGTFLATNIAYVTVTVCVPGTNNCQNIDHVQVDTGSSGLRLLSSASGGELSLSLPQQSDSNGNPLAECLVFLDGYVWGTVNTATVTVAGETAANVPIQVMIPSTSSPSVPSSCSSGSGNNEGGSVSDFGANGLIGVGLFQQDCGPACTNLGNNSPPDVYYTCPPIIGCSPTFVPLAQQLPNPVTMFGVDDNGVLIQLNSVPDGGSANVQGSLIFGIGTESNNGLGSATIYAVPDSGNTAGDITTVYNGTSYPDSFIDSGSNGYFFPDFTIPTCQSPNQNWFCPSTSPDNLTAGNQGDNMSSPVTVNFSIENATNLFNTNNTAFSTLGGPSCSSPSGNCYFDWGLPFFFGKNVFTAIDNMSTPGGTGPYFAY